MTIRFVCNHCEQRLRALDELEGRYFTCPACQEETRVPITHQPKAVSVLPLADAGDGSSVELPLVTPAKKVVIEDLIDMTSMVDVVFFLLIFFLVTSMNSVNSSIPMPVADPQQAGGSRQRSESDFEADKSFIVLRIDRNNTISVDGGEVQSDEELLMKLREFRNGDGSPNKALIVGSGEASHGTVVTVLDAGAEVGMGSISLAVRDDH